MYDVEMMQELGYCSGIENYSRVIEGRPVGSPPHTLLDYFPKDFVLFIDESHVTLPQAVSYTHLIQETEETTITSLRSIREAVADSLSRSISSLMAESFSMKVSVWGI